VRATPEKSRKVGKAKVFIYVLLASRLLARLQRLNTEPVMKRFLNLAFFLSILASINAGAAAAAEGPPAAAG
jgi:hypothetical protein